jgi:LysM repeat protein
VKRFIVLILALSLAAGLVACGPATGRPAATATPTDDLRVVVTLAAPARSQATAAAPEPLPLPTPLPTPTPRLHVVAAGDTLLAIARAYDVSVEALQAANGNVQPEYLQIGQELVIPAPGGGAVEPAGVLLVIPTPTPQPVQLAGLGLHETPAGGLWVLGEVVNATAVPLNHVQLAVLLLGPGGERLGESAVFTALDVIPPGERAPFGVMFPARPAGLASFNVAVLSAEAYDHAGPWAPGLLPLESGGGPAGALYRVSGQLRNAGATALEAEVVVTLYDAQGLVVGFQREAAGTLAPGQQGPFDVRLTPAGAGAVRHAIALQGTQP